MTERFGREVGIGGGIIAGSILLALGLLIWLSNDMAGRTANISANRAIIVQRARAIEVLASLKQNDKEVAAFQKLMDQVLPTQDGLLDFNRKLDQAARVNGISMRFEFQPGGSASPSGDQPGALGFRLDASGSFAQLQNFFGEIEKRSTQFVVSADSFDAVQTGPDSYQISTRARVFYR